MLKEDEQPVVWALEGVLWGGEALAQVEGELLAVFGLSLGEHGVAGEALGHGGEGGLKEAELEHGEQELAAHAARALGVVEAGDEQLKELIEGAIKGAHIVVEGGSVGQDRLHRRGGDDGAGLRVVAIKELAGELEQGLEVRDDLA